MRRSDFVLALAMLASAACTPQSDLAKPQVTTPPVEKPAAADAAAGKFGVILHAPPDWHVLNSEEFAKVRQAGADAVLGDDPELRRAADISNQSRTVIFAAFRYGPDAAVAYNPSVYASAANMTGAPSIKNARQYLRTAIMTMHMLNPKMALDGDFRTREIDGQVFDWMRIHLDANGSVVTQDHFAALHDGNVINIIQSYAIDDEAQRLETDKVISALEINW